LLNTHWINHNHRFCCWYYSIFIMPFSPERKTKIPETTEEYTTSNKTQ